MLNWNSLWDVISVIFSVFIFIAAFWIMVIVVSDLFRDKQLSGIWKAVWLLFLVFVPFVTAFIYVIARGKGMAERSAKSVAASQEAASEYIRSVAGVSPSEEIAKAKALLDAGTIDAAEYSAIKASVLSTVR